MEVDRDAVHSSPNSVSSIRGRRNQLFPPLPIVPDSVAHSSDFSGTPLSTVSLPPEDSQRTSMRNRNLLLARSGSLHDWIVHSARSQHGSQAQEPIVDVTADSPRNDVISVNDDSPDDDDDDDVIIDSDEETETVVERGENDEIEYVTDSDVADDADSRDAILITWEEPPQGRPLSGQRAQTGEIGAGASRTEPRIEDGTGLSAETLNENERRPPETMETLHPDSGLVPNPSTGLSSALTPNLITFTQSHSASVPNQSTSGINQGATVPTVSTSVSNSSAIVPVISAIVQLPTQDADSVSESSTGQTSQVTRVLEQHNNSLSEFRSPKRKRIFSPEKNDICGQQKTATDDPEEEEGDSCPICFESWTTSGSHRLCSLKCGHLFGQSCIEKWLKGQGGKCPHCNAKAKRQDIRVLFAKTIKALDTSERDRALKDLEKERELRRKVEMETAQLRLQYQMSIEDTNKLRLELETLKSQLRKSGQTPGGSVNTQVKTDATTSATKLSGQFILEKTIKISDAGNCRVMAYSHSLATLVVSQPSSSQLFPGFGIKKISALDFKTSQYLTIHSKPIRDMAFHQTVEDGILLSCGLDKKVKMTSLISNTVIQAYDTPMPAWSCAWNESDCNYFYAGLQNGLVLLFDVRNTGEPVQEFNKEGSRSPVASLVYVPGNQQADFRSSGLLIGQLDKVSFLEKTTQGERIHLLPLEGSLTSLHVDQQTRHMLASFRPTAKHPTIRHQLCDLTNTNISMNPTVINHVCSCNVVHTFHGGRKQTVLSKTLILGHPCDQNRLLVCGGDESSNSVHIWDSGTGQLNQRLLADGMVVDLCKFNLNSHQYLAALTDKLCKVFKWR